jgi:hypothetical protein
MGLDMYAYRGKNKKAVNQADAVQIGEWRKHSMLHGWMHALYVNNGGEDEFNCIPLRLKKKDLKQLKKDIIRFNLPETTGFFFGASYNRDEYMEYYFEEDLNFIHRALEAIEAGDRVYYNSWW